MLTFYPFVVGFIGKAAVGLPIDAEFFGNFSGSEFATKESSAARDRIV
jgi:hypothetical protein